MNELLSAAKEREVLNFRRTQQMDAKRALLDEGVREVKKGEVFLSSKFVTVKPKIADRLKSC